MVFLDIRSEYCIKIHLKYLKPSPVSLFFRFYRLIKVRWFQNAFLESSISSKKRTKTCCILVKMNSFVRFLEEFTACQFAFEIYWPLHGTVQIFLESVNFSVSGTSDFFCQNEPDKRKQRETKTMTMTICG